MQDQRRVVLALLPKRPSSACGSAAAGDIGRARSPLGTFKTSASQGQTGIGHCGSIRRSPELSDDSLEEPISAGVRRQRTYSDAGLGDPTVLTPSRAKRLKTYAKKVAEENDVPERGLFDFIDTSGIYYMLIDLKVCMMKMDSTRKAAMLADVKELLNSKDFKSGLQNRLTACLLSPNLTAYKTDALPNISTFIKENSSIFKVPSSLFEDVELSAIFATTVSDLLSSIRGGMKSKLLSSIQKHLSIMDTSKSLAHGCIEVDAAHWNRVAFLRCCLHVFMIGISDHKTLSLKALYSDSLIPSLHSAIRARIGPQLGIDINSIERELYGDEADHDGIPLDSTSVTNEHGETQGTCATDDNGDFAGTDSLDEHLGRPLHPDNSGFGDNGRPIIFSTGKFWDFVDISLENVRKIAKEEAAADQSGNTGYETAFQQIQVEYFQQDLAEFPGNMVIPKLLASNTPQWQTTIQNKLLWNEDQ
ncbi:uncharacterized protein EDB93DRAFT_1254391 [Suillus bovinus]|uniref:uncharacterized protein n=1 Tax=Suillus bovinus TaxID=48563 RepID=UPI001B880BB4|nr:uncharacterized protein EDB93DRAFT_1254391 [Suillus bovinus]KAG2134888.1 hypothetical protein EDB93DRAFT_1254391 [Suillus bovinus]